MAILGGSPLGLVGVQSTPHNPSAKGRSTFNGGGSRNVNVASYNSSKNNVYYANDSGNSLFTGKRVVNPWPEIQYLDDGFYDTTGAGSDGKDYKRSSTTNTEYDTSVLNIVEKLANTKAALKPQDFAYCKNLGVYPNNRLVVVRRFLGPAEDNIFTKSQGGEVGALALVISWIKEDEDFLSIDFGEEWVEAEASFTGILNSLGEDFGRSANKMGLGEMVGQGMGGMPLPGFTEVMTREILSKMGIMDKDSANLPVGNPNLIKQAKARKTIDYDQAGSGLNTKVSFKVTAEYELKFISGLDPTLIWMDLIGNFTRFGTSKSDTFGLSKNFSQKMKQWINNPSLLVKHLSKTLQGAILTAIDKFRDVLNDTPSEKKSDESESPEEAAKNRVKSFLDGLINKIKKSKFLEKILQKYKIKAIGIINALSGLPSTPWHITIGNPMRPIFASGDMYMDNVTLKLGSQLSFNNLPTNLTLEFTLTNARPWGMQEIMGKFSSGYLRTVNFTSKMPLSYNEINDTSVAITRAAGETQSTANTNTVSTNTDGGNTNSNETPGSVSTDSTPAVIDNSTLKVENNRVPLKGKKDEKGNLKFEKNEKLVLTDKDKSGDVYKTYTYVKNSDGSYTEYVTEKNTGKYDKVTSKIATNEPIYKTTTKVVEPGSADAKKLDAMFNKDGTVKADKQKSLKGDKNKGIKGVKSEDLPQSKEQKKVQTEALLKTTNKTNSTPVSMAANPNLVPFPGK